MAATRITKEFIEDIKQQVLSLHDKCIQKSGGVSGALSEASLEFAVYDILRFSAKHKNDDLLTAAHIYLTIATRHCFIDGNKRTSHLFAKEFLLNKGIHLRLHYNAACPFIIKIAAGENALEEIQEWLQQNTEKFEQKDKEKYLNDFVSDIEYSGE